MEYIGPSFCVLSCDIALGFASGYITASDTKLGYYILHIHLGTKHAYNILYYNIVTYVLSICIITIHVH